MTAKRFRFVSPGVKINEIDRSVITTNNGAIGPVVVGRFERGPGLVPVTLSDSIKFDAVFGVPRSGLVSQNNSDIWRTNALQAPTYASYAAQGWLANSSPLTVVKVLGVQHEEPIGEDALAGWKAGSGRASSAGGAWGLFVAPLDNDTTGTLAAVFYTTTGSLELVGLDLDTSTLTSGSNKFVAALGDSFGFRLKVKDGSGNVKEDAEFSLNKSQSNFIRATFNTNPVLTNDYIVSQEALKTYWLGESFESFALDLVVPSDKDSVIGCLVPLENLENVNAPVNLGDHLGVQSQPAKSGWVIGQDLGLDPTAFDIKAMPKLFRFSTLGGDAGDSSGVWQQNNVKISIEEIKASPSSFNKYGSFTVKVRAMSDTDNRQEVLETFSNLNLDPTSERYIARVIGDKLTVWDSSLSRHRTIGNYDNNSSYIRVEMNELLEQNVLDPKLLPFGFYGPPRFVPANILGEAAVAGALVSGSIEAGLVTQNRQLLFPTTEMVPQITQKFKYFGVKTFDVPSSTAQGIFDAQITEVLRSKPANVDSYEATGDLLEDSPVFTLDDVKLSGSLSASVWEEGSRKNGESLTALASGSSSPYEAVLDKKPKFTLALFGGSDGFRIDEKDPLRNSFLDLADENDLEGRTNYAIYSLKRALDTVADPEVLDMNLLTVPGVTNTTITNRVIEICETRADCLGIIDIPGSYEPTAESNSTEQERIGSVSEAIDNVKLRNFNTSYACTYYPWVKVFDSREQQNVWVPPSVVALGTMASSQEVSAVWFAPAGFNRGGLDRNGASGLKVVDIREVLRSQDRDDLYEVNINPIARFPSEGIVIFGQKTLQATPSALDRINVRRLVLFLKKQVSRIASGILFDQNIKTTWQRFINKVNPLMDSVKSGGGIVDYKVVLDETTTTPDLIDRNTMYAKIFIKPAYAIEFIGIDFIITNSGASFSDL